MRFPRTRPATGAVLGLLTILSACASAPEPEPAASPSQAGLDLMERLTLNADRCWFKSGDPAFDGYGLAPELASFSGKPRFLLTPAGQPEARPLLVVEGQSGSAEVSIYGPLLSEEIGQRARADVLRWQSGSDDCVV